MVSTFEHTTLGQRILFGAGAAAANLAKEVHARQAKRVMVIASTYEAEIMRRVTCDIDVTLHYDDVVMHVPREVADLAREAAVAASIDILVCIGGGSSTGLAKAIALDTGLPIIAIPTTYAGSEATNVWGMTQGDRKTTGVHENVLPVVVIYDAELTLTLPPAMSVASGLNALAHCIDSLWAPRADPINQAMALEGVRALASGLPKIAVNGQDLEGREQTLYGAYLAAVAFASAGSGMHHKVCHVLGGTFNLPHAQTHAIVLPYVLAFNAPNAPEAEQRLASAFGSETAVSGLEALRVALGAPRALRDIGFELGQIDKAVSYLLDVIPVSNPTLATKEGLLAMLAAAYEGRPVGVQS